MAPMKRMFNSLKPSGNKTHSGNKEKGNEEHGKKENETAPAGEVKRTEEKESVPQVEQRSPAVIYTSSYVLYVIASVLLRPFVCFQMFFKPNSIPARSGMRNRGYFDTIISKSKRLLTTTREMAEKKDERLAKLYSLMENGDWRADCVGIVQMNTDNAGGRYR